MYRDLSGKPRKEDMYVDCPVRRTANAQFAGFTTPASIIYISEAACGSMMIFIHELLHAVLDHQAWEMGGRVMRFRPSLLDWTVEFFTPTQIRGYFTSGEYVPDEEIFCELFALDVVGRTIADKGGAPLSNHIDDYRLVTANVIEAIQEYDIPTRLVYPIPSYTMGWFTLTEKKSWLLFGADRPRRLTGIERVSDTIVTVTCDWCRKRYFR